MASARIKPGATEYTRTYSDIRGVELGGSGAQISKNRLAYSENLYRDYGGDDSSIIESIPGYRRIASLGAPVRDIVLQRVAEGEEYLLVHAGTSLYRINISERDKSQAYTPIATLEDRKCAHFSHGGSVYFLSDATVTEIDSEGNAHVLRDGGLSPYKPIYTINGKLAEQKNLISTRYRVEYILPEAGEYSYGTPEINYKILDRELRTCAVTGIDRSYEGKVYIPSHTLIDGVLYRVTDVADYAFIYATRLKAIHVAEGVEKIGLRAFEFCKSATEITLPESIYEIGISAFVNCQALGDLYLGSGLRAIGGSGFVGCPETLRIHYASVEDHFKQIEGYSETDPYTRVYSDVYVKSHLRLPLPEPVSGVLSVTENGAEIGFSHIFEGERCVAVRIISSTSWSEPHDYVITVGCGSEKYDFGKEGAQINGIDAITRCTVAEVFDNRVFLSGNPALPNTVFYSSLERDGKQNPLYFGTLSYFSDGIGGYPVRSMLARGDSLAVFKSGDDGSGSIFYHTPTDTGDDYLPRIYPVSYVHSGIGAVGASISFMDDPVFLAHGGLYALDKQNINYERSVVCRSHNVNYDLQKEDLSSATLTEWCGYLVVLCGKRAYLADSRATFSHRSGGVEYEWFVIDGIGSYEDDSYVWRYGSDEAEDLIHAHPNEGAVHDGNVYYATLDGIGYYYGSVDGTNYSVYRTHERAGGSFYPATAALGVGDLLFFGTESGALSVFNNDKRGVAPEHISSASGFDAEEYAEAMGMRIHPHFYSFDGHAVRYALKSAYDNCDIPHLTKSTVKHSLTVRCKCISSATVRCEVGTENADYIELTHFPLGRLSFAEMDLGALTLSPAEYNTLPIAEKEKGWVEKQIALYSEGYAVPIGISTIAYRYTVKGRVKRS